MADCAPGHGDGVLVAGTDWTANCERVDLKGRKTETALGNVRRGNRNCCFALKVALRDVADRTEGLCFSWD